VSERPEINDAQVLMLAYTSLRIVRLPRAGRWQRRPVLADENEAEYGQSVESGSVRLPADRNQMAGGVI